MLPAPVSEDFPEIENVEGTELMIQDLESALACVLPAVSTDEQRYVLTGVCFDLASGCLIGTDGFRLHRAAVDRIEAMQFILPKRAVLLAKYGAKKLTVAEKRLSAALVGGTFTARLIEGNYPDQRQVWPDVKGYGDVQLAEKEEGRPFLLRPALLRSCAPAPVQGQEEPSYRLGDHRPRQ